MRRSFAKSKRPTDKNMESSLNIPCFRVGYSIETDKLDSFYKTVKQNGVTMTALLVKAVAKTLKNHPQVNSFFTPDGISNFDTSGTFFIAKTVSVPADATLVVLDTPIYLMEGDVLKGGASAASDLDLIISYESIDDA